MLERPIAGRVISFEHFELDLGRGCLRVGRQDIDLRPKAFDVMRHLAENVGRLVSKQELFDVVWPDVTVSEDSLVQCIRELRQKLGDNEHRIIKTVSRRGYLLEARIAQPPRELSSENAPTGTLPSDAAELDMRPVVVSQPNRKLWLWSTVACLACVLFGLAYFLSGLQSIPHQQLQSFKDCDACPEMVELPAGEFMMGTPDSEIGREGFEGPPRRVALANRIAIGKFEVTVDQFAAFVTDTGFVPSDLCHTYVFGGKSSEWPLVKGSFRQPGFRVTGDHPAVCISWHDATAYVGWLSRKTGRPYRLPTEAEWEYAARAGTTTAYSFGDDMTKLCEHARFADANSSFPWRSGCSSATFEPGSLRVGMLAPNPWGLFDMHGNAWEWAEDCWTSDGRLLPSDGSAFRRPDGCALRTARGGGWAAERRKVRSAQRMAYSPDARFYHLGLRVALALDGQGHPQAVQPPAENLLGFRVALTRESQGHPQAVQPPAENLVRREDAERLAVLASEKRMPVPPVSIARPVDDLPDAFRGLIGVWVSNGGWVTSGRQFMVIVTRIDRDGTATGYFVNGPATPTSRLPGPGFSTSFVAHVDGGTLRYDSSLGMHLASLSADGRMEFRLTFQDGTTALVMLDPFWLLPPRDRATTTVQ